ncbi:AAA family ATPase [Desulfococcus sp.]|uniref:ATP-binding protein n=1 Tax=Desulfococcus sp. TaxID=2025834 RepID=UPI003593603D
MRILRLDLIAFGPFTDATLRFREETSGFHLVFGPNEAGKSSALRALRQMLFGIPARTADDFIHPYGKLRIGALIEGRDGRRLEIIRRKGRVHTLRGPDDIAVVEETRLRGLLGGVDEGLFATLFGIDHAGLADGGRAILQGTGDAGQILFAAGAGIADFRKVLGDLKTEAETLFKPGAQKPAVNAGLAELQKIRKALREAQLPGQAWVLHDQAFREAMERKARIEADLERETRQRNRLMRIRDALPAIARHRELSDHYETVKTAVLLPVDFGERHLSAVEALRIAESRQSRSRQRIEELLRDLEGLTVPDAMIDAAEAVEALFQEAGSVQKAASDRLRLEGLLSSARIEARERLRALGRDIPLEQADALRVRKPAVIRIQELTARYERLQARRAGIDEEIGKLALRTERLKIDMADLPAPVDQTDLKLAISEAAASADLESRAEALQRELHDAETGLKIALSRLPLWTGPPEALERLPLPSTETVDAFELRLRSVEDRLAKHRAEAASLADRLGEIDAELRRLALSGGVPTEADLTDARSRRDQAWRDLRRAWETHRPIHGEAGAARGFDGSVGRGADQFEALVRDADDLSDRLRREAERVAAKASLLAEQERLLARSRQAGIAAEAVAAESAEAHGAWIGLWKGAGIHPLSPREMRGWLLRQADLANRIAGIRDRRAQTNALLRQIGQYREAVAARLDPPVAAGDPPPRLSRLLAQARAAVSRNESVEARKTKLSEDLNQRMEELREARKREERTAEDQAAWRRQWEEAVRPLGLDGGASPAQANSILSEMNLLFEKIRDADILAARIRGIDRDMAAFAEKVRDAAASQAPDLLGLTPTQAVRELHTRLAHALRIKAAREGTERQLAQERDALREASEQIQRATSHLDILCREAGCDGMDGLRGAEARSEARRRTEADLERTAAQLRSLSGGRPLGAFIADASSVDPDTLDLQLTRMTESLARLDQEKSDLDQAIGGHRTELAKMDGGHQAADLAEQGQALIAAIRGDALRFLRLKLAGALLNRAMERYREKNQGPIVRRAATLFSRMTLGSFEGLRLEVDETNTVVIAGVRPGGREAVHVSGMSDGTADQLYLAIRLASLEAFLKNNAPLPFIVDDILVQFDDRRAGATLEALLELSRETQVIFFTHHRHLVELARSRLDGGMDILTIEPGAGDPAAG